MKIFAFCLLLALAQGNRLPETFVSDSELLTISDQLYAADSNRMPDGEVVVDTNGDKFIKSVNEARFSGPTYSTLITILNMYTPEVGVDEADDRASRATERAFLDAAIQTPVMQKLWEFLLSKDLASSNFEQGFRDQLYNYWFTKYSRSRGLALDSSGFEHVFAGELKSGKVSGFHNWVQFYNQEKSGDLEYSSYIQGCEPALHVTRFYWKDQYKRIGSLFVGTSPEYDLALYTLCFVTRPGGKCYISMDGNERSITTYVMNGVSPRSVGTAYPDCS